jgi:hypothetical protein
LGLLAPGEDPKKGRRAKSSKNKRTLSQETKDTRDTQNNLSLGDNGDFSQINIQDQQNVGEKPITAADIKLKDT